MQSTRTATAKSQCELVDNPLRILLSTPCTTVLTPHSLPNTVTSSSRPLVPSRCRTTSIPKAATQSLATSLDITLMPLTSVLKLMATCRLTTSRRNSSSPPSTFSESRPKCKQSRALTGAGTAAGQVLDPRRRYGLHAWRLAASWARASGTACECVGSADLRRGPGFAVSQRCPQVRLGDYCSSSYDQPDSTAVLEFTDYGAGHTGKSKVLAEAVAATCPAPVRYHLSYSTVRAKAPIYAWEAVPPECRLCRDGHDHHLHVRASSTWTQWSLFPAPGCARDPGPPPCGPTRALVEDDLDRFGLSGALVSSPWCLVTPHPPRGGVRRHPLLPWRRRNRRGLGGAQRRCGCAGG